MIRKSFRSDKRTEVTVCRITFSSLCAGISTVTLGGGSGITAWSGRSFSIRARMPMMRARPLTRMMPKMKVVVMTTQNQ